MFLKKVKNNTVKCFVFVVNNAEEFGGCKIQPLWGHQI